jgi:hypothetical protein
MRHAIAKVLVAAAAFAGAGALAVPAASAAPAVNHCPLWANPVLHPTTHPALGIPGYPHCYANEHL